ncbi:MAG: GGDEF domain-containing protein [Candidatus Zixiibacteriota bacterium]|nr:MAG: GGDEF domain-containing protein [candidate division Zixibacteria bacterium]
MPPRDLRRGEKMDPPAAARVSNLPGNGASRVREILRLLDQDRDLPTLSPVVEKVLQRVKDERVSIRELAEIIKNDVSLSFKILKVVNSAFYGFPRKISTLTQAMVILGLSAVKNLALSMSILEIFVQEASRGKDGKGFRVFWERSLFSAVAARRLALLMKHRNEEEVFIAALLQDIGTLLLIKHLPEDYAEVMEKAQRSASDIVALEEDAFGINHAVLGEFLANKWRLPRTLTIPILRHHNPSPTPDSLEPEEQHIHQLTQLVQLSNQISAIFYEEYRSDRVEQLKQSARTHFNISPQEIEDLLDHLADEVKEVAEFFGLPLEGTQSYSELLMAANIALGKINLTYEQMNRELIAAKKRAEELSEQLAEANRKLQEMANVDGLTQIFNRRVFQNLITREFYRSHRYGHPLSCIMIDLDHFKHVNDSEGHLVGDQVLREVAALLHGSLRKTDFLARYGGEEFVVILPEAENKAAATLAEKLRRAVEAHPFDIEGRTIHVTISLGVATYSREMPVTSEEELVQRADANLYLAKRYGRNRTWTEDDSQQLRERLAEPAEATQNEPLPT